MRFSRQEYWSGLPFPPPGGLPGPGIEPISLCLLGWQADSWLLRHLGSPVWQRHVLAGAPGRAPLRYMQVPSPPSPWTASFEAEWKARRFFWGGLGSFSPGLSHLAFYISADFENKILWSRISVPKVRAKTRKEEVRGAGRCGLLQDSDGSLVLADELQAWY